ncbi:tetratricopeptide (TPR) repeat protein [Paenibacillus rhizosphaerae]|uniref:Tetratricopeptide (TPR) repeat protein n=1 Tax=Paenibacillus rhizosphaerae TaxID=297318 RepID=A0A839TNC2_9BACL|nr:tetratricopeptide repeat protein [Paenibacillus rhizosphaerae]MBB3126918.1 tetratricopeptide (TPR) repeat protein [Paenibacillus rhizosphaerae]
MNTNQKAISCLEQNKYDEALSLFKQAVEESRDVQSLSNLAWIFVHEEEDYEAALALLQEAIALKPASYFPYNLLGEVYIVMEKWQEASDILVRSLAIQPSEEAYNNLAVARYHLGDIQTAADYFQLCAQPSDYAMYSHMKCLIELGRAEEAKRKLDAFSEEDEEFVGQVEVAELYVELDSFEQAVEWFEKGWKLYWKTPDWVSRFVYALLKINKVARAHEVLSEVIQQKTADIGDADKEVFDDDWTEDEIAEYFQKLADEQKTYEGLLQRISAGYNPPMKYDTSLRSSCYLFGCERHHHPEYHE